MTRKENLIGSVAALFSVGGAIALAFSVALRSFWPCPQGGCSLTSWAAKAQLLASVAGVALLLVLFTLLLLFVFVLFARPFVARLTLERVLLGVHVPGLGWYDKLQLRWIALLYSRAAA